MSTTPWDDYAGLDSYGQGYAPEHAFRTSTDTLPNGDYDCEVISAEIEKNTAGLICRATLQISGVGAGAPPRTVEHTYWLNKQKDVNAFCAELAALGFPAHQWGAGPGRVPLSQAIPHAVSQLRGVRFRASKTSREGQRDLARPNDPPRIFHDLRIHGRLGAAAPMPAVAPAVPAMPNGSAIPVVPGVFDDPDKIPFSLLPFLFALATAGGLLA